MEVLGEKEVNVPINQGPWFAKIEMRKGTLITFLKILGPTMTLMFFNHFLQAVIKLMLYEIICYNHI